MAETDTIEVWKTSLIRRQKRDTSWRKRTRSRHEKRRLYAFIKATRRDGKDTIEAWKTSLLRRQKATRRDGNGHDRGMKNVAYTSSKTRHVVAETDTIEAWKRRYYAVKKVHVVTVTDMIEAWKTSLIRRQKTTRRDGNGHDRGMKNVGDTSSKKRHVVTRRHVEKNNFWTDDVNEL